MKKTDVLIKRFKAPIEDLSKEDQLVLSKLEKAAELTAEIYVLQTNDKYPGANLYPHDVKKEEIIRQAKEDSSLLNPYTIVEKKGNKLIAIPYHIKYADKIKPIANLLREAAQITKNKDFEKRLEVQADALEDGSYEAADIYWLSMAPYKIGIFIGPLERYEDSLFYKKNCYTAAIGILDEEATRKAIVLKDAILSSHRKSFTLAQKIQAINNIVVGVGDAAILSGLAARTLFSGYSLPNDPRFIETYGVKVIILKQVVKFNFDKLHYPIFKSLFEKKFQQGYSEELLLQASSDLLLLREISVSLVKYHDADKRLGDLFPVIDEISSYILAIKQAGLLMLKDLIPQKNLEAMIIMLICRAFDFFISSQQTKSLTYYSQGYALMINYFLEEGALREYNGISWVNFNKVFMALCELALILDKILAFGDMEDAQRFINEYGDLAKCLKLMPKLRDIK